MENQPFTDIMLWCHDVKFFWFSSTTTRVSFEELFNSLRLTWDLLPSAAYSQASGLDSTTSPLFYWVNEEKKKKRIHFVVRSRMFSDSLQNTVRTGWNAWLANMRLSNCCSTKLWLLPVAQRMADTRLLLQCDLVMYQTLFFRAQSHHNSDRSRCLMTRPSAASIQVLQDCKQASVHLLPLRSKHVQVSSQSLFKCKVVYEVMILLIRSCITMPSWRFT